MDIARSVRRPEYQGLLVEVIVVGMVRAGCHDRIDALVDTVVDPGQRADVLIELARNLLLTGDLERAAEVSRRAEVTIAVIPDSWKQCGKLTALAAVIKKLDPHWTRRVAAQLLRLGRWRVQVDLLAELRPDLIDTIVEELSVVTSTRGPADTSS
jgi:hypothetical protein